MKRIFIAVDISDEARERAARYAADLGSQRSRGISWVKPENLHLTLRFLGDCDTGQLERVNAALQKTSAKCSRFSLTIANTGVFPTARKARVLWLGVDGEVAGMVRARKLFDESFGPEIGKEKPLTPHLTIARVRDPYACRDVVARHLTTGFEPVTFTVDELVVYESKLRPTGSVYTAIARFGLKT
jgi:2'-5' RNA ligase